MKRLLALSLKKKLLVGGVIVAMAAGGLTAALNQPQNTGADTSPLVQQVNHNTDELKNHEDRISNNERNITDLQNKTNTPSNSSNVTPHAVTTPSASSSPLTDASAPTTTSTAPATPAPVTITGSALYSDTTGASYCLVKYSDGTTGNKPATITTHQNPDGSMSANDNCSSYIGQAK